MPNITVATSGTLSFVILVNNFADVTSRLCFAYRPDGSAGPNLESILIPVAGGTHSAVKYFSSYVFQPGDVFHITYRELRTHHNETIVINYVASTEDTRTSQILSYVVDIKNISSKLNYLLDEIKLNLAAIDTYMRSLLQNIWATVSDRNRRR